MFLKTHESNNMIQIFVTKKEIMKKRRSPLTMVIAAISIHTLLPLAFLCDIGAQLYQAVYFRLMEIPPIPRSKYVRMERHKLPGLSLLQRWSCWYCEYVNTLLVWLKEVANQTELYSCAIRYEYELPGQEYQKDFYDPKEL